MTVQWDPALLARRTRQTAASLIASGIDPDRSVLFVQSEVAEHTELAWILTCLSRMGELNRMTQFKEKSKGAQAGAVGTGLLTYPLLMAADVLAYRAELVPIGDDQRQHLELMREIAERFNRKFGDVFAIPEAFVASQGARIMALDDPSRKMDKSSDRPNNLIWMNDPAPTVRKKIARAVTDSGRDIKYVREKPAISNLLEIFSAVTGRQIAEIESAFDGRGYADFKAELAEAIVSFLGPFQAKYDELMSDIKELDRILEAGALKARAVAQQTMKQVRREIGLRSP